jgi:hypothetical protein
MRRFDAAFQLAGDTARHAGDDGPSLLERLLEVQFLTGDDIQRGDFKNYGLLSVGGRRQ